MNEGGATDSGALGVGEPDSQAPEAAPAGPAASGSGSGKASPATSPPETLREAFAALAKNAGLAQVNPGEIPTAASLLRAIGGVRGLIEALTPGMGFLILYTTTRSLVVSVLVPVGLAAVFVIARLVARTSLTQALAGMVGVAISAALALFTGRAEDNFLAGIIINAVSLTVLLVSLLVRYPLVGVLVGLITGEFVQWREVPAKRRILTLATWLWCGLFGVRLLVELPLYLSGQVELLAAVKLILGVPFYAGVLWVTWLVIRTVYLRPEASKVTP
ncbi:MAG: DUF3159 domain-containing protein [Microbacteriaceae bacterium]|nr:DUF3159 domain-containing protein [Microbacteriaceae bacterium]